MWLTGLVAPWHVGSSQTRARTRVPCISRQILNHCATREALLISFESKVMPPGICHGSLCLFSGRKDEGLPPVKGSHSLKGYVLSAAVQPALSHRSNVVSGLGYKSLSTCLISTVTKQIISPSAIHLGFLSYKMVTACNPREAE